MTIYVYRKTPDRGHGVFAAREIRKGEHIYTATSVDQFAGKGFWVLDCRCGSEKCRRQVTGDLFQMPQEWQARYYPHLPPSVKRKHGARFRKVSAQAEDK